MYSCHIDSTTLISVYFMYLAPGCNTAAGTNVNSSERIKHVYLI